MRYTYSVIAGFSVLSAARHAGGPREYYGSRVCTTANVRPPAGLRGACSARLKLQGDGAIRRIACRVAKPDQDNRKPHFQLFCRSCCICYCTSHRRSSSSVGSSHGTPAATLQGFPLMVAATNGRLSVFVCMCPVSSVLAGPEDTTQMTWQQQQHTNASGATIVASKIPWVPRRRKWSPEILCFFFNVANSTTSSSRCSNSCF